MSDVGKADGQPETAEGNDLGEARKRSVKRLDLTSERHANVADQDPGDEDGQEPGAVGDAGQSVDDAAGGERSQRVEAARRQWNAHQRCEQEPG